MGLLDRLFGKQEQNKAETLTETLDTFTARTPMFNKFGGSIYEMELTRSVVHAKAKHTAKLSPHIVGGARKDLENILKYQPNEFQTTYDFLYRLRTLYEVDTYVFVIPLLSDDGMHIKGFYPLQAPQVEIMEHGGTLYLRYKFINGETAAIEYDRVGILSKMSYENEFFGDGNGVLSTTMSLLDLQNQGIDDAIRQGATIRFMAQLGQVIRDEDLKKERDNFSKQNLSAENKSGVLLFDQKYSNVKQIENKPFVIDEKQLDFIKNNIFSYFGINEDILQNKFNEDVWNAFYEGEIEPFAIQLSLALTNMIFTSKEKAFGNEIHFSANRLQYASNQTKLNVSQMLFDRGIAGTDDIAEIWNMPQTGDNKKWIRGEYVGKEFIKDGDLIYEETDEEEQVEEE
jgi:hypothetical protein